MMKSCKSATVALCAAWLTAAVRAADPATMPSDVWVSSGVGAGGWFNQVRAGPSGIILCNSDLSGTYLSRDRGRSWADIGAAQGLRETHASAIGFDPADANVMFIGTEGGVYRSEDAGGRFTKVAAGFYCTAIVLSAKDHTAGYAVGMSRHDRSDPRVYATRDNGKTWQRLQTNLPATRLIFEELVIDPTNPQTVYAHAFSGRFADSTRGLFKTTDGGHTWAELAPDVLGKNVEDFAVDPKRPNVVYASGEKIGVAKSVDGGRTWTTRKTDFAGSLFVVPDRPDVVRVLGAWSMQESTDAGEHWKTVATWPESQFLPGHAWGGSGCTRKNDDLSDGNTYFWRNSCWVWASFDGGRSVRPLFADESPPGSGFWKDRGLKNTNLRTIEFSPADPATIYAGYWDMGLWRSLDHGRTWQSCNNVDLTSHWTTRVDNQSKQGCGGNCRNVAPDPTNPDVVWATIGGDQGDPQIVYKSEHRGRFDSWTKAHDGLPATANVSGLCVDPTSPPGRRTLYVTADGAVFKSVDGAAHWIKTSNDLGVSQLAVDRHTPGTIYAGGERGLFVSRDGGATWSSIGPADFNGVADIEIDPSRRGGVYVVVNGNGRRDGGLYRSDDDGRTWARLRADRWLRTVAVDPKRPDTLYIGSSSARDAGGYDEASTGVSVSHDGGQTWTPANEGLAWPFANVLRVDPGDSSFVIAGVPGLGVQVRRVSNSGATR